MSSRISRGSSLAAPPALEFRSIQGIAASVETKGSAFAHPARQADAAEYEQRIRAAYEQGMREGHSAADGMAVVRAKEMVRPVVESFRSIVEDLANSKKRLRGEAEEDVVKLALAISRRVLHRELAIDPEALIGLIRTAMDRLAGSETHRLRLSQDDVEAVLQHTAALNLPPQLEIQGDPALARGSALFETSRGTLDASIGTQLAEIERGLADVLLRRKAGV